VLGLDNTNCGTTIACLKLEVDVLHGRRTLATIALATDKRGFNYTGEVADDRQE